MTIMTDHQLTALHRLKALLTEAVDLVREVLEPCQAAPNLAPATQSERPERSAIPGQFADHIVWDTQVSETSPVVKGTWVTIVHVVSMIVDGWGWDDICQRHPEITSEDIRACLAYTVVSEDDQQPGAKD